MEQLAGLTLAPATGVGLLEAVALPDSPQAVAIQFRILLTGTYRLTVTDIQGTPVPGIVKPSHAFYFP
jgi:hypothetical protein